MAHRKRRRRKRSRKQIAAARRNLKKAYKAHKKRKRHHKRRRGHRSLARIHAINAKAQREGRLKIVNGYYYRRYDLNQPYFSDGVTDRKWREVNGKMVDQNGNVHDWRKEAEEHSRWNREG